VRVLFLNNYNYLRGGAERVLFEEMRMLKEAGHEVAVFSRVYPQNEPSAYDRSFPPDMDTGNFSVSLNALRTAKELIYSWTAKAGVREVILDFKPDVAHAHNIYGRLTVSILDELEARGIPTVLTMHDLKLLCPSYLMLNHGVVCEKCRGNRFYQAVLTKCHKNSYAASAVYAIESWINYALSKYDSVKIFISPSRFLRNKMIEYGWSRERIVHVPNLANASMENTTMQVGNYNLYFGRLSREKGVRTLLKAYKELKGDIPLVVVGDGPEKTDLQKVASDLGLPVIFTGYLSGQTLHDTIGCARSIVMSSECYENAPLSILEAFAHGKPVIGARIGGIPEMIDDGVNGLLFEPGNVDDLSEKLSLMADKTNEDLTRMGRAAREKVKREYSVEAHYKILIEVYSKAVGMTCA
jgi:glycosyltransferase involved in cell wall biosynthesis